MQFTSYPCVNDKDTGYISVENVNFVKDGTVIDATPVENVPQTHKLTLRQLELGDEYHIALLFHYYRIFYKTTKELSEAAENAIVDMINTHISNNDSTVPSYDDVCRNKLLPEDVLNEPAVKDILYSMAFVTKRHQVGHSIIFVLYLESLETTPTPAGTGILPLPRHRVSTQYGIPIAFTLMYPLFSSMDIATHYLINDLYVDSIYRSLKCGTRLLQYAIQYTKEVLKPLSPYSDKLILSICTGLTNKAGQRLYPYMGFKEVERSERNQWYEYHMEL